MNAIFRTKQWMSDAQWQKPLLYMPGALGAEFAASGRVPDRAADV